VQQVLQTSRTYISTIIGHLRVSTIIGHLIVSTIIGQNSIEGYVKDIYVHVTRIYEGQVIHCSCCCLTLI